MAYPQVYKHTRFRSQLEISFVKMLDARGLRWFYEPERLGEHRYLLDFYLPDGKCWVECKGKVSTRDYDALLALAVQLKQERNHGLYMFTINKAYRVTDAGFGAITHEQFWDLMPTLTPRNGD